LAGLARLSPQELMRRPGVGPAKAAALAAALEVGRRLARAEIEGRDPVADPDHAGRYLVRRLSGRREEVLGILSVDSRHGVLRVHELTRGTRNQAPADPAEVFRRSLLDDAAGVIVFHNHPSGALEPSSDDIELTRRLVEAGRILNVAVHDHLVIAGSQWLSLRHVRPELFS
jgi:DNA repair protein RadC